MTLQDKVTELAIMRADQAAVEARLAELNAEIAATPLGIKQQMVAEQLSALKAEIRGAEGDIRGNLGPAAYNETGSKKPCPGVSIRLYHKLDYDPQEVLAWCKANAADLVLESVDTKRFEKVATTLHAPVIETWEPLATIAKDLSDLLPELEPACISGQGRD